ncbi:MAG: PAS domain S-box protein [Heteroscytonema crispum UTEX LB 1556]
MNKLEQVEAALRESERRFRAIFNQSFEFIGLMEPDGTLIEANQTALDFGGLTSEEVINRPFWEARWWTISPLTQAQLRNAIARAASGEFIRYEVDVLGAGDTVATIDFSIQPLEDENGRVCLLIPEGRDITELKQAIAEVHKLNAQLEERVAKRTAQLEASNQQMQELLRREREARKELEAAKEQIQLYADIVKNMQVGLNVWQLEDPEDITTFRLVATNPVVAQMTGVSLENHIGSKVGECYPNALTENRRDLELYRKVVLSGEGEDRYETFYGDDHISGRYFSLKVFPLPNRCVGLAFDNISDRKLAEQALRESERRWSTLAKMSPVGIFRTDTNGDCLYVNERWCEIAGLTLQQAQGKNWRQAVHPDDLAVIDAEVAKGIENNNQCFKCEFRLQHSNGKTNWVFCQAVPEKEADGKIVSYIGTVTDISDRKLAEITLQQRTEELTRLNTILAQTTGLLQKRNQELDQFAYVASHDLKAPLRAISSLSAWIEEDLGELLPKENQQQMRLLRGRVNRMEALINGLLEYSRVGRINTEASTVNVGALLKDIIDSLDPPSTFTIEVEPKMPTLLTKRIPLQQVFANLISNAIKHHKRPDGYVKISVQDQGKYYEFAVTDDGPGIAPEYHKKVFVIFQTLEARDSHENTGIGLAIVKKIVEIEGGAIALESQIGAGSTFRFTWLKSADVNNN